MYEKAMTRLSAILAATLAALFLAGPVTAAGDGFVAGIDDLPLMPGLHAVAGEDLKFDKPGGRFVEASARGAVTPKAVSAFYARTLPQLGWRSTGADRFQREDETLQIDFPGAVPGEGVTVRFTLAPR